MASAGARDHLVTVEQRTTVDAPGYPVERWAVLGRYYMSRKDESAYNTAERFTGMQTSAAQVTTWQVPYLTTMDPEAVDVPATRRLVYQRRTYDIQAASLVERREIELVTLTGSAVA